MRSHAPILQFLPRSCLLGGTNRETSDLGPFKRLEVILDACFVARRRGVCNEQMLQLLQPSASWCLAGAAGKICWEQGHLVPAATPVPHGDGSHLQCESVEAVMALRAEAVTNDGSSGRSLISVLQGRGVACAGH